MLPRQTKSTDLTKSFSNVNLSEYGYVCVLSSFCAYENVYERVIQNQKLPFLSNKPESLSQMNPRSQKSALIVLFPYH